MGSNSVCPPQVASHAAACRHEALQKALARADGGSAAVGEL
jgi:hypothetical protein